MKGPDSLGANTFNSICMNLLQGFLCMLCFVDARTKVVPLGKPFFNVYFIIFFSCNTDFHSFNCFHNEQN